MKQPKPITCATEKCSKPVIWRGLCGDHSQELVALAQAMSKS